MNYRYSVWFDIKSNYSVTCYCVNLTFIGCNLFVIKPLIWYYFGDGHLACFIVIYLTSWWLTKLNYHQMCGSTHTVLGLPLIYRVSCESVFCSFHISTPTWNSALKNCYLTNVLQYVCRREILIFTSFIVRL